MEPKWPPKEQKQSFRKVLLLKRKRGLFGEERSRKGKSASFTRRAFSTSSREYYDWDQKITLPLSKLLQNGRKVKSLDLSAYTLKKEGCSHHTGITATSKVKKKSKWTWNRVQSKKKNEPAKKVRI